MTKSKTALASLLKNVRACTHCTQHLPLGPRPIVRIAPSATVLIIGQAPGTKVHESGVPWDDKSGDRLREWLATESPSCPWGSVIRASKKAEATHRRVLNVRLFGMTNCARTFPI